EDKLPFLEQPIPAMPVPPAGQVLPLYVLNTHTAWVKASKEIDGLMLMTIDLDIQKNLEQLGTYDMLKELKMLYAQQEEHELLQTDSFVQNYNMHSMGKSVTELHVMLKLHEQTLPPKDFAPALHTIRAGRVQKTQKKKSHKAAKGNQRKGKAKMGNALVPAPSFAPKPKNPPTPKKDNPAKDAICHQCGEVGHWRRNCPVYLVELQKKKNLSQGASTSGIFTTELYSFPSTSWVYDTGCCTHSCITTHGLRGSRKLNPGALSLGIISVSRLYKDGFVNRFENDNSILVSRNNLVYFCAIPRDDIYEIDLSSSNTNDSSMYAISNKRAKLNLDSTLLWHYRLGHIRKKCIKKLQHDGLLNSTDIKSFEKYVSYISGKMARKPYSHLVERAKDLLGLIYTDVCGPFKTVPRQGARYFITFTGDFSRYGYVYLLKHKHEVFETFKVFQKEVENQLGKTIKSLRFDCGDEYMSQEFMDHLKDHRIIVHQTPPYTPQHNGVSKRRNRTLLDIVRSMMSQTTLPKSFWDYALESAARILNMVPTKKVENTSYEVWHGQAPKLSYLKVWGCEALVKRDTLTNPDKLEPRSIKSTRTRRAIDRLCLHVDAEEHELGDLDEPANYKAAMLDHKSEKWLHAMNVEIKWLFKKKTAMDGAVHNYKARLVVKGFTQTNGIDYEETFSPIADIRAIGILIYIAAFYDYEIWQMDVKTAFFNGHLSQPAIFINVNIHLLN
ncbi:retrotransposon protein, putative, ty1-copia subclass, partial [Tanacetum coccineum]